MTPTPTHDWLHLLVDASGWVGVVITLILYIANEKRKDRKAAAKRADEAKTDNDRRHEENKLRLDQLLGEREYLKPHDHIETIGALMAEGIIRKRNGR